MRFTGHSIRCLVLALSILATAAPMAAQQVPATGDAIQFPRSAKLIQEALANINQHLRPSYGFGDWLIPSELSVSADSASGDKLVFTYDIKRQSKAGAWKTVHHVVSVLVADLDVNSLDSTEHKINSQAHIKCKGNASCATDNGIEMRDFYLFCKSGYAEESADYLKRILLVTQHQPASEIRHYSSEKEILAYLQSNSAPTLQFTDDLTGFNRRFSLEGDDLVMRIDLRNSIRTGLLVMRMKLSQLADTVGSSGGSIELLCNVTRAGQLNNCITDNSGDAFPHIEIKEVSNSHEVARSLKRLILLHESGPALPKGLSVQPRRIESHSESSDNSKTELPQLLVPLVAAPAATPSLTTQVRKTLVVLAENVTSRFLLSKVQPSYPPLAKQARISGAVVLKAVISKDGSITDLRALSGHPMLIQAATDAVRQWRYKPYVLEGEPMEVDTQITVNFTLVGG